MTNPKTIITLLVLTMPFFAAAQVKITLTDSLTRDQVNDNKANPGDSIRYKIQIIADGVASDVVLDSLPGTGDILNYDPSKFHVGPIARADSYTSVSNMGFQLDAAGGLLANDVDIDNQSEPLKIIKVGAAFAVDQDTSLNFTTAQSGTALVRGDGSFDYYAPVGFVGEDHFFYEVTDGDSITADRVAKVTIQVGQTGEPTIWFVHGANGDDVTGNGTFSKPFKSFAPLNNDGTDPDGPNDIIFVYTGVYSAVSGSEIINLESGQKLIGQNSTLTLTNLGLSGSSSAGFSLPPVTAKPTFSNSSGDGIVLSSGNQIVGLEIGSCSGVALKSGSSTVGDFLADNLNVVNSIGRGILISNGAGTLNVDIDNFSSGGGDYGIYVNGPAQGLIKLNGIIGISGTTVAAVNLTGTSNLTFDCSVPINTTAGGGIILNGNNLLDADFKGIFSCTTSPASTGISLINNTGSNIDFSGNSFSVSATSSDAILITNASAGANTISIVSGASVPTISSTMGKGISGSNFGTLNINNGTVNSTSGTAIDINNANLTVALRSVSSSNATGRGISIVNCTGSFGILGDGSLAKNNSGGQISTSFNEGIYLENFPKASLNSMLIESAQSHGLKAMEVTDLDLTGMVLFQNGNQPNEYGIDIQNAKGTGADKWTFENIEVKGSYTDNVHILNSGAVGGEIEIYNSIISEIGVLAGGNGLYAEANGGSFLTLALTNSFLNDNRGVGLNVQSLSGGNVSLTATNNSFLQSSGNQQLTGVSLGAFSDGNFNFDIDNNTIHSGGGKSVNLVADGGGLFAGSVDNNQIDPAELGLAIDLDTRLTDILATAQVSISGNTINENLTPNNGTTYSGNGIRVRNSGPAASGGNSLGLTIQNNSLLSTNLFSNLRIDVRSLQPNGSTCLNLTGNNVNTGGSGVYRINQEAGTGFNLQGYAGLPTDPTAIETFIEAGNTGDASASGTLNVTNVTCTLP